MDPHAAIELLLSAAASTACGRLIYLGLRKEFPALLSYLLFIALENFIYGVLNPRSTLYFWVYVVLAPLENVFDIIVVRELLTLMFQKYPGIRTVARWAMYLALGLSVCVSLVLTKYLWNAGASGRVKWGLFYLEITQRAIVLALVAVILAILFALSRYPLHLGRNTYVSCAFFSILFLSEAAELFIDATARGLFNQFVDRTQSVFVALCLASWALLLRPEKVPAARVAFSTPQEEHLLHQLDALNQMMTRAARR